MENNTADSEKASTKDRRDKSGEDIDFGGRRKTPDRRRFKAKKEDHDPERRSGKERRSGFDRRSVLNQKKPAGKERRKNYPK